MGGHHFLSFNKGGSCVFVRCFAGSYLPPGRNNKRSLVVLKLFVKTLLTPYKCTIPSSLASVATRRITPTMASETIILKCKQNKQLSHIHLQSAETWRRCHNQFMVSPPLWYIHIKITLDWLHEFYITQYCCDYCNSENC